MAKITELKEFTTLANRFRDVVSKSKDFKMKQEAQDTVQYSTGFLNFDFMNGSIVNVRSETRNFDYYSIGIADGSMCMFIGRSGCGKTTFAMQAAGNIANSYDTTCVFHDDIEGGISSIRKQMLLGFDKETYMNKYICRDTGITAENFYERIKTIYDIKMEDRSKYEYDTGLFDSFGNRIYKLEPTIYLLDSIALLMPEQYTEEEQLSGQMSSTAAAKTNSMVFKRVIPMLKAANIILIMINHINEDVQINPYAHKKAKVSYLKQGETLPGGNAIVYLSNLLVRFDDVLKLKEEETFGISGSMVDLTLVKSRNNKAGSTCTIVLDQNRGFDPELSLFITLKNANIIGGAGAYLFLKELPDIKFSQKNFKEKLYNSEEFRAVFIKTCVEYLKSTLINNEDEAFNNARNNSKLIRSSIMDMLKTA